MNRLLDRRPSLGEREGTTGRRVVDSSAAQPARSTVRSVAVHLMCPCASIEGGVPGNLLRRRPGRWVGREHPVLEPAPSAVPVTVIDVAGDDAGRPATVDQRARTMWSAWGDHHDVVRSWAGQGPPR